MRSNTIPTVEKYLSHTKALTQGLKSIKSDIQVSININYRDFNNPWNTALANENFYGALSLHRHLGKEIAVVPTAADAKVIFNAKKVLQTSVNECKRLFPGKSICIAKPIGL